MNERVSERNDEYLVWLNCAAPRHSFVPFSCHWLKAHTYICVYVCLAVWILYDLFYYCTHTHSITSESLNDMAINTYQCVYIYLFVLCIYTHLYMHQWIVLCCKYTSITKCCCPLFTLLFSDVSFINNVNDKMCKIYTSISKQQIASGP